MPITLKITHIAPNTPLSTYKLSDEMMHLYMQRFYFDKLFNNLKNK